MDLQFIEAIKKGRKDEQGNLPIDYANRKKYDSVVSVLAG